MDISHVQGFNRFFYTHGHDKSLWSVANHLADAAGIDSQIYELMADTNPTLAKEVRIIEALPEAPTGPIVVRSDLDPAEKEALRHIFYTMHEDDDLAKAMKTIVIDRFIPLVTALSYQFWRGTFIKVAASTPLYRRYKFCGSDGTTVETLDSNFFPSFNFSAGAAF